MNKRLYWKESNLSVNFERYQYWDIFHVNVQMWNAIWNCNMWKYFKPLNVFKKYVTCYIYSILQNVFYCHCPSANFVFFESFSNGDFVLNNNNNNN